MIIEPTPEQIDENYVIETTPEQIDENYVIETTPEQIDENYVIETTPEQIAKHYSAAMDSVNLINALKAKPVLDVEETGTLARNQEHLVIMLAKDYWTDEDLTPLRSAAV